MTDDRRRGRPIAASSARLALRLPGRIERETLRLEDANTISVVVQLEHDRTEIAGLVVDRSARRAYAGAGELELTNAEFALLELLARDPRRVVSHGELREALGWPPGSSTRTVTSHLARVRRRLREQLPAETWVVNRWGFGYILLP